MPYLETRLPSATRLDVVWDINIPDSLKESTWAKRSNGVHRKDSGETKLPGNWMDFLRDSMNKKELSLSDFQGCTVQLATSQSCVRHIMTSCSFHW